MPDGESQTWDHLGYIVVTYIVAVVGYSFYLNQPLSQQFADLLRDIPDFLKSEKELNTKISIALILFYVFLQTVPLVISSFLVVNFTCSEGFNLPGTLACIIIPFVIYFWIVDRNVVSAAFTSWEGQAGHGVVAFENAALIIIGYYFAHYKIPLTLAATLLGGYGGYAAHRSG